jgi:8-oxo-dGTP diphosphatase
MIYSVIVLTIRFKGRTLIRIVNRLFFMMAYSIDQFGNVSCQYLFNDILIKKSGHKFGNHNETISSVLGRNKKTKTLSVFGKFIVFLLNTIDPFHVEKAVDYESKNKRK